MSQLLILQNRVENHESLLRNLNERLILVEIKLSTVQMFYTVLTGLGAFGSLITILMWLKII